MIKFKFKGKTYRSTQKTDNIVMVTLGGLVVSVAPKLYEAVIVWQDQINIYI